MDGYADFIKNLSHMINTYDNFKNWMFFLLGTCLCFILITVYATSQHYKILEKLKQEIEEQKKLMEEIKKEISPK